MLDKSKTPKKISEPAIRAFSAGDPRALQRVLRLPPWTPSPLDVDGPNPPAWAAPNGLYAADWRKA